MGKLNFLSLITLILFLFFAKKTKAQTDSFLKKNWKTVANNMPDNWYGSIESFMAADSVLKYQTTIGGWMKNTNFHSGGMNQNEWLKNQETGIGATFDNDATITEIRFLAKMYAKTSNIRYKRAFEKGLNYVFISQYDNGGWPQFFPANPENDFYSRHITYNDNAMINIMELLDDIAGISSEFSKLKISKSIKNKAKLAIQKGISCILKTQIVVNGKPTVWCAQHDEITLLPAKARTYELPSYSGGESADITLYLMNLKNPSSAIKAAINGAVKWFETHKIEGIRIVNDNTTEGAKNKIVINDKNAPPIWARFYDLETEKPFFCDRDGIKKASIAEIGSERRNGYNWYETSPSEVLKKFPDWAAHNN